jgi:hypothetical protein
MVYVRLFFPKRSLAYATVRFLLCGLFVQGMLYPSRAFYRMFIFVAPPACAIVMDLHFRLPHNACIDTFQPVIQLADNVLI